MRRVTHGLAIALGILIPLGACAPARGAELPPWLPHYDLDIRLDLDHHEARVRQVVTWTNRHARPAGELVFNAHSHYHIPDDQVGFLAKMLEILRMTPSEALILDGPCLEIERVTRDGAALPFHYQEENTTALVVPLPCPVATGESVTVAIDFRFRLPPKQGRWGQWEGITFLSNWLPVLAVYGEEGWQPTPYIPWHQPFFNEAGIYTARVTLPADQQVACGAPVRAVESLPDGLKRVECGPCPLRDFALLCSARFHEVVVTAGTVEVRCLALPEHEHYAREMVRWVCEALPVYEQWIGPYPYRHFTIVESFFGWNGNECGGLVMIDERVFNLPHVAGAFVEYLISHEFCHQWFYNTIGTNGYCETWMDEGWATYLSHRLMDKKHGRNNQLLQYPRGLEWAPNIHRETYRFYSLYGTIGRGENGPVVQEMPKFTHLVNLLSMCYDKGGKIVGMIEDRLGEAAFFDFLHILYSRYYFRIIRVQDLKRELEEYTGRSWDEFFRDWLYGGGLTDWSVEHVKVVPVGADGKARSRLVDLVDRQLHRGTDPGCRKYNVSVLLHQKAEYNEPTVLGISLDGSENYQIRIPIEPRVACLEFDNPPTRVRALAENRIRVDIVLPCMPTQIAVDPDQVLVDRDPVNNYWKPRFRYRVTPIYTLIEETDVTAEYDKWNILFGPAFFGPAYNDPWFTRSTIVGLRAGLYRTQRFAGGAYVGYRTDDRDIVAGVDGLWDHVPWDHTQIGFNLERSIARIGSADELGDRGVLFGRYVFGYGDSLYLPPMHYAEIFASAQDRVLPPPRHPIPGTERFDQQSGLGIHYHLDYLTPYWDPEGGFRLDASYTGGVPVCGPNEGFNRAEGQFSIVKGLPDWLGPLSETRVAARIYGAAALPDRGDFYTLGGGQLFRGYDLSERQGSAAWVGSLEWRVPLIKHVNWDCCDHAAGIRNIYGAFFYDVGDVYALGHSTGPVSHALGGGLCVDVAWVSLIERTTLRFDVAQALDGSHPLQFWFGVQHPF